MGYGKTCPNICMTNVNYNNIKYSEIEPQITSVGGSGAYMDPKGETKEPKGCMYGKTCPSIFINNVNYSTNNKISYNYDECKQSKSINGDIEAYVDPKGEIKEPKGCTYVENDPQLELEVNNNNKKPS